MATATLPYPDIDYVPLDILTAAELNQMVANDEYMNTFLNGLADGSNISDATILTRHLSPEVAPICEIVGGSSAGTASFSITRTPTTNGIVQIISSHRLSTGEVIITPSISGLEDSQVSAETTTSQGGSGPVVGMAVGKCTAGTPFTYTLSKSASVSLLNLSIMITITPTFS